MFCVVACSRHATLYVFSHSMLFQVFLCYSYMFPPFQLSTGSQAEALEQHRQRLAQERREFMERSRREVLEIARERQDETWNGDGWPNWFTNSSESSRSISSLQHASLGI